MSEKENEVNGIEIRQPKHDAKKMKHYSEQNQKATMKLESQTELRQPRGKNRDDNSK